MSGNSAKSLGGVSSASRQIGRNDSGGEAFRGGQGGPRGGGSRRPDGRGSRSGRGFGRGRGRGFNHHESERLPTTPEGWERKLADDADKVVLDQTLALTGTGIPILAGMRFDFRNQGAVGGQLALAIMLAACMSMRLGRVVELDGSVGRRIRSHVLEDEYQRIISGG